MEEEGEREKGRRKKGIRRETKKEEEEEKEEIWKKNKLFYLIQKWNTKFILFKGSIIKLLRLPQKNDIEERTKQEKTDIKAISFSI